MAQKRRSGYPFLPSTDLPIMEQEKLTRAWIACEEARNATSRRIGNVDFDGDTLGGVGFSVVQTERVPISRRSACAIDENRGVIQSASAFRVEIQSLAATPVA